MLCYIHVCHVMLMAVFLLNYVCVYSMHGTCGDMTGLSGGWNHSILKGPQCSIICAPRWCVDLGGLYLCGPRWSVMCSPQWCGAQ